MPEKTKNALTGQFIDNPHAPEIFAADAIGFLLNEGSVCITFTTPRANHATSPAPVNRVVVARIAMPLSGAQGLAVGLYDFLKKQGLDPAPVPEKNQQQ